MFASATTADLGFASEALSFQEDAKQSSAIHTHIAEEVNLRDLLQGAILTQETRISTEFLELNSMLC